MDAAPQTPPKTRRVPLWAGALGLIVLLGLLGAVKAAQISTMMEGAKEGGGGEPAETVTSAKAEAQDWPAVRAAIGTLVAVRGVTLGAELPGTVRQIAFENGATLKAGDLLVRLDTSTEEAQLAGAMSDVALAQQTLERQRALRKSGAATQADLEAAEARATLVDSTVANMKSVIAKKTLRAPFDGRIGIRQVELGQVVSPGTPIASLQTVDPILVEFSLPQQALSDLKTGERVAVTVDVFPKETWEGSVLTVNPEVDVATRNVRTRATLPNPKGRLTPGMFVRAEVFSGATSHVIVVPSTAILFAPYGDSVFVLQEKKDAAGKPQTLAVQRFVRLGERRGDLVVAESGLAEGEQVVSNGAFKLHNNVPVAINNALAPKVELNPKPEDQ